jgi:cytosine/adenosine deaminase-related metal-dependent hydrolase
LSACRTTYRAAWVLPIETPPLRDGLVTVENGAIVSVGRDRAAGMPSREILDLGHRAVLPGLVNAHTHLELSWMRGRVPPARSMPEWARAVIRLRRDVGDDVGAIDGAIAGARAAGTSLVGDIGNTLDSFEPIDRSPLHGTLFYELLGFRPSDAGALVSDAVKRLAALKSAQQLQVGLAAHAPYSTAPALFRHIDQAVRRAGWIVAVHVAESAEEVEFVRSGRGAWRTLLEDLGVWNDEWIAPGCGPVEYLDHLGFLGASTIVVHAVHATVGDLASLAARGTTIVTCPRSNRWTGAGTPPIDAFYASGCRVAVGTDSLASVEDLSVFAELAELRRLAPDVPARRLLESATMGGARALGLAGTFGSIAPGKRADLIAVELPVAVGDVEEHLVSGITPDRVRWIA